LDALLRLKRCWEHFSPSSFLPFGILPVLLTHLLSRIGTVGLFEAVVPKDSLSFHTLTITAGCRKESVLSPVVKKHSVFIYLLLHDLSEIMGK
jgi:hypothetical protein